MGVKKAFYTREEWLRFSTKIKERDNYQCVECNRNQSEVVLQVHHLCYTRGKMPWEYPFSACITLCKGCHARQHGLIPPAKNWQLVDIIDLGDIGGKCERQRCGEAIRYEHLIYHPAWGYLIVGSVCIDCLTEEDQEKAQKIMGFSKKANAFANRSKWKSGVTRKGFSFISTKYKNHTVRIYGLETLHSFQIGIKKVGYSFSRIIDVLGESTETVKRLTYITLRGMLSEVEGEKELLREIYKRLKEGS